LHHRVARGCFSHHRFALHVSRTREDPVLTPSRVKRDAVKGSRHDEVGPRVGGKTASNRVDGSVARSDRLERGSSVESCFRGIAQS
jgi:hypothetical protein